MLNDIFLQGNLKEEANKLCQNEGGTKRNKYRNKF
jgi:hypothetical protein